GISKKDIPAELVTASGSGLDPDITPAGAYVQVKRVAASRNISEEKVKEIVDQHIRRNPIGPDVINVLALNVALEN
ncbi:MAG: potassium-transporting ATPase subunit C, partial [Flavitalea sp.]